MQSPPCGVIYAPSSRYLIPDIAFTSFTRSSSFLVTYSSNCRGLFSYLFLPNSSWSSSLPLCVSFILIPRRLALRNVTYVGQFRIPKTVLVSANVSGALNVRTKMRYLIGLAPVCTLSLISSFGVFLTYQCDTFRVSIHTLKLYS